ncbi:hypothetical protein ACX0G9_01105 [Flavitalea flava]
MNKITNVEELRAAIRKLEDQHYIDKQFMTKRVTKLADDLKPINLAKKLFSQAFKASEVKSNLLNMAAGMVTSFLVKKFFKKKSKLI